MSLKASLMVTCLIDALRPDAAWSAVRVLQHCGVEVDVPTGQTCCGQPAFNSGFQDDARRSARALIRAFADSERVICPSGSCTAMIRHKYPDLFRGTPNEAEASRLADRVYELSEFLVDVLGVTEIGGRRRAHAVIHDSCHTLRLLGIERQPRVLLESIDGLELLPLPRSEDCCGFGGTFAVKMAPISAAMVDEKVDHILATGADLVTSVDMSCLVNIGGRLHRRGARVRTEHLAEVLAAAAGAL